MQPTRSTSEAFGQGGHEAPDIEGLYPIRTVSAITGVNAVTLRAWERRYGLVKPQRTPKGHRLYTEADIERIHRILELLRQGIPIGQTRRLIDSASNATSAPGRHRDRSREPWEQFRERALSGARGLEAATLEDVLCEALSLFPVDAVTQRLLQPMLADLRASSLESERDALALHFLNAFLRNEFGARLHHQRMPGRGPRLLLAGLPGDPVDAELLMFTVTAASHGYKAVLLGPELPPALLASAALQVQPRATIVFGDRRCRRSLEQALRALASVPAAGRVFIGGSITGPAADLIDRHTGVSLPDDTGQCMAMLYESLDA